MRSGRFGVLAAAITGVILLSACGRGDSPATSTDLAFFAPDSLRVVANSSEVAFEGDVVSDPTLYDIADDSGGAEQADNPRPPQPLAYEVVEVKVRKVWAAGPSPIGVGQTVAVGVAVLNPETGDSVRAEDEDAVTPAGSTFSQIGARGVFFVTPERALGEFGQGYEALAWAEYRGEREAVVRAVFGSLRDDVVSRQEVGHAAEEAGRQKR